MNRGRDRHRGARAGTPLLAAALTAVAVAGASAQEDGGRQRSCTLVLEPATDSTRSTAVEVAEGQYVTHVWNGLRWSCGDARMYADSAVKFDRERRLKAIGSIDYRDSLRTLTADTLTYHEAEDRLVAEGDAELRRRDDGSTLAGPRIVFLRAGSEADRRTLATGRPHMTVRREGAAGDSARPTSVDADRILLVGRDEARTWGDVVIERPDATARADSAFFDLEGGVGNLYGSPEVEGRAFTLAGRTIRTASEEGELRAVEARDSARATGEGFELYADTIRARLSGREIERLWAHGGERSVAVAPPYRLEADSLAFRFRAGALDTLRALSGAEAVEIGDSLPGPPLRSIPLTVGRRSWLAADTLVMDFVSDSTAADTADEASPGPGRAGAGDRAGGAPGDSAAAVEDTVPPPAEATPGSGEAGNETRVRRLRAVGSARAYRVMAPEEGEEREGRSLHYQRGSIIVVDFEEGEAVRVEGERAIGLHLDPLAGESGPDWPPAPAAGDTAAGSDTVPSADTLPTADSAAAVPDTVAAPADTAAPVETAPADTAGATGDTVRRSPFGSRERP